MVILSGPSLFPNTLYAGGVRIWAYIAISCAILLFADAAVAARLLRSEVSTRRLIRYVSGPTILGVMALVLATIEWIKTDQLQRTEAVVWPSHSVFGSGYGPWQAELAAVIATFRNWNVILLLATIVMLIVSARQVWYTL